MQEVLALTSLLVQLGSGSRWRISNENTKADETTALIEYELTNGPMFFLEVWSIIPFPLKDGLSFMLFLLSLSLVSGQAPVQWGSEWLGKSGNRGQFDEKWYPRSEENFMK